jgi:hypothetical protein
MAQVILLSMSVKSVALFASMMVAKPASASPLDTLDLGAAVRPEIAVGMSVEKTANQSFILGPAISVTLPAGPGLETSFALDGLWSEASEAGSEFDWNELGWAVKWELAPLAPEGRWGATIEPALTRLLSSQVGGSEAWRIDVPIVVGVRYAGAIIRGSVGYGAALNREADAVIYGLALEPDTAGPFKVSAEMAGSSCADIGGAHRATFNAGIEWELADNLTLLSRLGRDLWSCEGDSVINSAITLQRNF